MTIYFYIKGEGNQINLIQIITYLYDDIQIYRYLGTIICYECNVQRLVYVITY